VLIELLGASSLLMAMGADQKKAVARFLTMQRNPWLFTELKGVEWPKPGTRIGIGSAPMFNTPGFWKWNEAQYLGDPDHAIVTGEAMGIPNRFLVEGLLAKHIPYSIEGDKQDVFVFIVPSPIELFTKMPHPRPPIFSSLRNIALDWRNGHLFDHEVAYDEEGEEIPEIIDVMDEATTALEWVQRQAKAKSKHDLQQAVDWIEKFMDYEDEPWSDAPRNSEYIEKRDLALKRIAQLHEHGF
jgi:hypothetical protein